MKPKKYVTRIAASILTLTLSSMTPMTAMASYTTQVFDTHNHNEIMGGSGAANVPISFEVNGAYEVSFPADLSLGSSGVVANPEDGSYNCTIDYQIGVTGFYSSTKAVVVLPMFNDKEYVDDDDENALNSIDTEYLNSLSGEQEYSEVIGDMANTYQISHTLHESTDPEKTITATLKQTYIRYASNSLDINESPLANSGECRLSTEESMAYMYKETLSNFTASNYIDLDNNKTSPVYVSRGTIKANISEPGTYNGTVSFIFGLVDRQ